jgi:hypothetical protein
VCRQCRFDLSGCPDPTITCPECGAGLKRPGSTRIGQRRKRPIAIAAGAAAILLPLAAIAVTGFALLTGSDIHKYMPLGVLLWESRHTDPPRQQAIAAEILRRYNAKTFSEDQIQSLVGVALDLQGDLKAVWAPAWGDFIDSVRLDGKLTDAQRDRYHAQATVLEFQVRPNVRAGDSIPVMVRLKEARVGSSVALTSSVTFKEGRLDQRPAPIRRATSGVIVSFGNDPDWIGCFQLYGAGNRWGVSMPAQQLPVLLTPPRDLSAGTVPLSVAISVSTQQTRGGMPWGQKSEGEPTHTHQCELRLEQGSSNTIELVQPDAATQERMERLFNPLKPMARGYGDRNARAEIGFNVGDAPLPAAFDVIWSDNGKEWNIGVVSTGIVARGTSEDDMNPWAGQPDRQRHVSRTLSQFNSKKVDVILRPSADVARRTIDITRIYGAEIVYKDVEVEFQNIRFSESSSSPAAPRSR